jgi:Amt family ammonium transporter
VCWLFFNAGSGFGFSSKLNVNNPAKIIMNTILSAAASSLTVVFFKPILSKRCNSYNIIDVYSVANSMLAGLVGVTAACNNIQPWASIIIGIISSILYTLSVALLKKLKIDDPLENFSIHGVCGIWGALAVGIFDNNKGCIFIGNFKQLLYQCIGIVSILVWGGSISFFYFFTLKKVNKLRVGYIYEITGMDVLVHGGNDLLTNEVISKIEITQRRVHRKR